MKVIVALVIFTPTSPFLNRTHTSTSGDDDGQTSRWTKCAEPISGILETLVSQIINGVRSCESAREELRTIANDLKSLEEAYPPAQRDEPQHKVALRMTIIDIAIADAFLDQYEAVAPSARHASKELFKRTVARWRHSERRIY